MNHQKKCHEKTRPCPLNRNNIQLNIASEFSELQLLSKYFLFKYLSPTNKGQKTKNR
jgi:hypothetical protein